MIFITITTSFVETNPELEKLGIEESQTGKTDKMRVNLNSIQTIREDENDRCYITLIGDYQEIEVLEGADVFNKMLQEAASQNQEDIYTTSAKEK